MLRTTRPRLLWKFAHNFGWGAMRSMSHFQRRLKKGVYFPPFLYLSVINSCNLQCKGCWVSVDAPRALIERDDLDKLINEARQYGNRFFGILGGEPFMHPEICEVFETHRDCYFQVFTNGQLVTDKLAQRLARAGNVTPLVSIEGNEIVSDQRRGRMQVYNKTLRGLQACLDAKLITGVATSVCQNNLDLVSEQWLDDLIRMGVHYCWFYSYRPVGPEPMPELALSPEEQLRVRRFVVEMRRRKPIILIDAYWDADGNAQCPAAIGISHHVNPWGQIEPCPVVQFAKETIDDQRGLYETITESAFLEDFRKTAAATTRGCILLERPDVLRELIDRHGASDGTHRKDGDGFAELDARTPMPSQHNPGNEVPEDHWLYRYAKKKWFFGFGAYM